MGDDSGKLYKFNIINFAPEPIEGSKEELSAQIHQQITNKLTQEVSKKRPETLSAKLEMLESILLNVYSSEKFDESNISKKSNHCFASVPGDTRFPYSFSALGDHCSFVAAVMELLVDAVLINIEGAIEQHTKFSENLLFNPKIAEQDAYKDFLRALFQKGDLLATSFASESSSSTLKPRELRLIARVTGLLHDVSKPDHKTHVTSGVEKVRAYLEILKLNPAISQEVINAIEKHHGRHKMGRLFPEFLIVADHVSTTERKTVFDPDFFLHILNDAAYEDVPSVIGSMEKKDALSNALKNHLVTELRDFGLSYKKYGEMRSYPLYTTSKDDVENSTILKRLREISKRCSGQLDLDIDLTVPNLGFFFLEFKGIQSFIFASSKLKRIKNSSDFISRINRIFHDSIASLIGSEAIVSSGGGSLIALCVDQLIPRLEKIISAAIIKEFPEATHQILPNIAVNRKPFSFGIHELHFGLSRTMYDWNALYERISNGGDSKEVNEIKAYYNLNPKTSVTGDAFKLLTNFIQTKGFGELVGYWFDTPNLDKLENVLANQMVSVPVENMMQCYYCQNLATKIPERECVAGDGIKQICSVCDLLMGDRVEAHINPHTVDNDAEPSVIDYFRNQLIIRLNGDDDLEDFLDRFDLQPPQSIDDLSLEYLAHETDKIPRYLKKIAFIKMDGNNVGVMKSKLPTPAAYNEFSRTLDKKVPELLLEAAYQTIKEWIIKFQDENYYNYAGDTGNDNIFYLPVEPIIIGGDDITLICQANLAFALIEKFFVLIEEYFGEPLLLSQKAGSELQCRKEITDDGIKRLSLINTSKTEDLDISGRQLKGSFYPSGFSGGVFFCDTNTAMNRAFKIGQNLEEKAKEYIKSRILAYQRDKIRCIGAWNSIAVYYNLSNDLTISTLEDYYSGVFASDSDKVASKKNGEYIYVKTLFPMSSTEFKSFRGKADEITQYVTSSESSGGSRISYNKIKTKLRSLDEKGMNQNKLEMYYQIGREKDPTKKEHYRELMNLMFLKSSDDEEKRVLIPLYDLLLYLEINGRIRDDE